MSESYATIQEAEDYFDERLHDSAWRVASASEKPKSLLAATRIIDTLSYKGYKNAVYTLLQNDPEATQEEIRAAEASQALEFPRGADTDVPQQIQWACFEIAYSLLDGVDPDIELENMSIRNHGIGSVRTSFNRNQEPLEHFMNGVPSATAWKYLRPFLRDDDHIRLVRV